MRICVNCHKEKSLTDFGVKRGKLGKDGISTRCKECTRSWQRKWYLSVKNNPDFKDKVKRSYTKVRNLRREKMFNYLQGKSCIDCGFSNILALHFDHVRGKKVENVSTMVKNGRRWETIEKEIAKCEIRCANCHMVRTFGGIGSYYKNKKKAINGKIRKGKK